MVHQSIARPCPCVLKGSATKVRKCRRAIKADDETTQYQKRKHSPSYLWSVFKTQAKRRGIDTSLTKKQYTTLIKKPCQYCGGHKKGSKWNGVDRIDSEGSYSPANSVACCAVCNYMKASLGVDEFLRHTFLITSQTLKNKVEGTFFHSQE